jgi:1,4-dihydroxy-2-naphthoate octaprenyltransferase
VNTPWKLWLAGARPRTFPAAVVPVAVGTAVGYQSSGQWLVKPLQNPPQCHTGFNYCTSFARHLSLTHALLALVVALGLQIGTNYVNDYADGERGTDDVRTGPLRLVATKAASVQQVKIAALISFGIAGIAGLILAVSVTWWFVPIGAVCAVAGWAYTGGPRPYGYLGFGELFVFLFFGLVATAGSAYVQHAPFVITLDHFHYKYDYQLWGFAIWAGAAVGLLAAALLQANNLRDIVTDKASGKLTLAVRLGRQNAGLLFAFTLMAVALIIGWLHHYRGWSLLALLAMPLAIYPVRLALGDRMGRRLLPMLGATARLQIGVGLLLTIGILI